MKWPNWIWRLATNKRHSLPSSLEEDHWATWLSLARHPWFATLANALGVIAGLMGALYTESIRNAVPFQWTHWNSFSIHALIFWAFFIIFAFTFLSREWSVDRLRVDSEKRLEDTIRTMPPRGFVSEFAQYYGQCHKAVRALDDTVDPGREQIKAVVRMLLSSMAQLARRYDAAQSATYAANVMLYWETPAAWQSYAKTAAFPDVKFVELEAALDRLPMLVIERTLSASTVNGKIDDPDPALANIPIIALPVPRQNRSGRSEDGKRWRVLPGAPLTFFRREANSYEDSTALGKWCREHGDFSESVCLQIEQYFGQDEVTKNIRSFASMPINSILMANALGVVNLHSNRPGILSDPGAPSQFFPLMEPIATLLADAVLKLLKAPE